MKKALKHIFTGKDNETHDVARWCWVFGVVAFVVLAGYAVHRSGSFDMQSFGIGFGSLMAASGAAVKLKEKTEPDPTKEDQ